MGPKERRTREREETRSRILDAAREMFVQDGIEAVTMREIAKRIEYTPTAIYHHFRDKQALIEELCLIDFRSLAQAFQKIGRIEDPIERVRRIGLVYMDYALEHPSHYRFMFMTPHAEIQGECEMQQAYERDPNKDNPNENSYLFLLLACEQARLHQLRKPLASFALGERREQPFVDDDTGRPVERPREILALRQVDCSLPTDRGVDLPDERRRHRDPGDPPQVRGCRKAGRVRHRAAAERYDRAASVERQLGPEA